MMENRRCRAVEVLLRSGIALAMFATHFSNAEPPGEPQELPLVVVTGSILGRVEAEGALPVRTITRKQIDQSGSTTITEVLERLPQNENGFSEKVATGVGFSPGTAAVSLRGLGADSTLVLVNGRRFPLFPFAQNGTDTFVDLNSIPLAAVDRIEVLKEGASAIYGSDAIAGVINIITRKDFTGAEVQSRFGNTTRRDLSETQSSLVSGFSDERFSLLVSAEYYHRNSLADLDRSFSRSANHLQQGGRDLRSVSSNPGTIFAGDVLAVPHGSNGRLAFDDFLPGLKPTGDLAAPFDLVNKFDTARFEELIPETERHGVFGTFEYNLFSHVAVFGEGFYQNVRTKEKISASTADSLDGLFVPATNPFNPFGADVAYLWRAVEAGPRLRTTDAETYRLVGGLRVKDLPNHWQVEIAGTTAEAHAVTTGQNFLSKLRTQEALNDTNPNTSLNVFGDGFGINNPATIMGLKIPMRRTGRSELQMADIRASGDLFNLPAGPASLGLGAEYRGERFADSFDKLSTAGDVLGQGGFSVDGSRSSKAVYFDVALPVFSPQWKLPGLYSLELETSGRYEEYSDFGDTFKPKFAIRYKPVRSLLLRGSYSEGFRAPSLPQLFVGNLVSFQMLTDPVTGQTGDFMVTSSGNPKLKPENSYSYSAGGVYESPFLPGLSIGADLFRIEQRNLVQQFDPQTILQNEALFAGAVERDVIGQITNIKNSYINVGSVTVDGVDFDLEYERETAIGEFTFGAYAQFINGFKEKVGPGLPERDLKRSFSLPEFKSVISLLWKNHGFGGGAAVNYIGSYGDVRQNRTVSSWTTVDLQASYEFGADSQLLPQAVAVSSWRWWLDRVKLTLGVLNVADKDPPFADTIEGYDPATHDARGRFYYLSLRKTF